MDLVSQVSRPVQIALLVTLVVGAAWLLVLRPKGGSGAGAPAASTPVATTPATTTGSAGQVLGGLGRAIDKARATKAAGDQQAAQASNESATSGGTSAAASGSTSGSGTTGNASAAGGSTAGTTSSSSASAGATSSSSATHSGSGASSSFSGLSHLGGASSPAAVASALAHHRVVALLFWNPAASDDRYVRAALKQVHFSRRRVLIAAAPIGRIAQYTPVTGSLSITESPTIVIVDPTGRAHLLVGYVDPAEITRAIQRALLGNSAATVS